MASPAREITIMSSKTQRVMDDIRARIASGEYPPGSKLPSAREMRDQYDVSQMTIRIAIERLRAAGVVTTAPGAGVFVTDPPAGTDV